MYEYKCILDHVVDGNTIIADIDLGFNIVIRQKIRLFGVTLKTSGDNSATERLKKLLPSEFIIKTVLNKRGKFGRIMGYLLVVNESGNRVCINDILINEGVVIPYKLLGRKKQ